LETGEKRIIDLTSSRYNPDLDPDDNNANIETPVKIVLFKEFRNGYEVYEIDDSKDYIKIGDKEYYCRDKNEVVSIARSYEGKPGQYSLREYNCAKFAKTFTNIEDIPFDMGQENIKTTMLGTRVM